VSRSLERKASRDADLLTLLVPRRGHEHGLFFTILLMWKKYAAALGLFFLFTVFMTGCTTAAEVKGDATAGSVTWCVVPEASKEECFAPVAFKDGDKAYDTLVALDERESDFSFAATEYGDAGYFITEINGVASDDSHFWKLSVNNEEAQVGISSILAKANDKYTFAWAEIIF
jgi:hypothetical protein